MPGLRLAYLQIVLSGIDRPRQIRPGIFCPAAAMLAPLAP
jgi:hypothetical protein